MLLATDNNITFAAFDYELPLYKESHYISQLKMKVSMVQQNTFKLLKGFLITLKVSNSPVVSSNTGGSIPISFNPGKSDRKLKNYLNKEKDRLTISFSF